MAGTPLSRDLYDRIVAAYRECPGNHSRAARAVGVDRRMTTRAWTVGWPKYTWARPIAAVLAEEYDTAKSRAAAMEDRAVVEARAERERAAEASIEARTEEEQMIKAARKDVLSTLIIAAELVPAMRTLGQLCVGAIGDMAKRASSGEGLPRKELAEALGLVDRHARLVSKAVHAADAIVKLSRLDRGQPGYMVGVQPNAGLDQEAALMTDADAVAELEHAADLLEELKQQGALPAELEQAVAANTQPVPALEAAPDDATKH